ncbi:putative Cyclin [Monocercomonoides exilis]|uniref:putative Cyclin n=1 Tax=Monocercomonoides exilis TaxID=2049356 RepID=UPI00355A6FCB|nr:putative Cyclin [Monocercomonoides exilis]|eukprot:MONOS_11733.1-p1 / transcript=MONOS_11733.1 / gene=MONOS_11733 / organism=Monocercomonoides_exilis_PA203 / gene_product=unspecified product / transcript_product=unspecified product / location=Mono_scaffold00606:10391-11444(+) / protein_length=316 / sequence_SO=supercontig / SO=protein_coding / is_pseudo=false
MARNAEATGEKRLQPHWLLTNKESQNIEQFLLLFFQSQMTTSPKPRKASSIQQLFDLAEIAKGSDFNRFIKRLVLTFCCSYNAYFVAAYYVFKVIAKERIRLTEDSRHRLYLASLILAIKYIDDMYYSNEYYATQSGVDTKDLYDLEAAFFAEIDYSLFFDPQQLNSFLYRIMPCERHSSYRFDQAIFEVDQRDGPSLGLSLRRKNKHINEQLKQSNISDLSKAEHKDQQNCSLSTSDSKTESSTISLEGKHTFCSKEKNAVLSSSSSLPSQPSHLSVSETDSPSSHTDDNHSQKTFIPSTSDLSSSSSSSQVEQT